MTNLQLDMDRARLRIREMEDALRHLPTWDDGPRRRYAVQDAPAAGGTVRPALFDLFGLTAAGFKIRGTTQADTGAAWLAGAKTAIDSDLDWDGATDSWASGTVTESVYVYLSIDSDEGTVTLVMDSTLPDGDDVTRVFPLWYVPFDSEEATITRSGIVDMRPAVGWDGPAEAAAVNDFSWRFVQTSDTGGTVTLGQVFLGGVAKTVGSFPGSGVLAGVTTSTKYWVAIDRSAATATWGSGASVPASTDAVEYWTVLELTCAGNVITGVLQRMCSDIRVTLFA